MFYCSVLSKFLHLAIHKPTCSRFYCSNKDVWDIVISGGGMVGCAMACALGASNIVSEKKILLLESSPLTNYSMNLEKYSNRVSAINPSSRLLFERIGAWEHMKNHRVKEVKKLQVWESCSESSIGFNHPGMMENVAHIIENDVILSALNTCLDKLGDKVQVKHSTQATNYDLSHSSNGCITIGLKNGETLKTKLLIGADGPNSIVRKTMGIKYLSWSYKQKGVVATLKLAEPTSNVVAWQRFIPSGPIALLPLTDDMSSLVWTVTDSLANKLLEMTDEEFTDLLNLSLWSDKSKNPIANEAISSLQSIIGSFCETKGNVQQLPPSILSTEPKSRTSFPLGLGHAANYVTPGVALIGDAAHRVHPLAGQGVNLGFGDVECLSTLIENSLYNGKTVDCMDPLFDYEVQRQRHVVPSMLAIDALNRFYGTEFTPTVVLRSMAMTLIDSMGFVKKKVMEHAAS